VPVPGAVPVLVPPVLLPPVLVPPVLEPMLPVPVPLDVPPAAPELLSFRQRSLSSPLSCAQRALPELAAPVAAEPLVLLSVEVLPPMLLPVLLLLPTLPLGAGVWAAADIAKSAAAVAETNSFRVMNLLLGKR
jgi:hypothetical protein